MIIMKLFEQNAQFRSVKILPSWQFRFLHWYKNIEQTQYINLLPRLNDLEERLQKDIFSDNRITTPDSRPNSLDWKDVSKAPHCWDSTLLQSCPSQSHVSYDRTCPSIEFRQQSSTDVTARDLLLIKELQTDQVIEHDTIDYVWHVENKLNVEPWTQLSVDWKIIVLLRLPVSGSTSNSDNNEQLDGNWCVLLWTGRANFVLDDRLQSLHATVRGDVSCATLQESSRELTISWEHFVTKCVSAKDFFFTNFLRRSGYLWRIQTVSRKISSTWRSASNGTGTPRPRRTWTS